MLLYRLHESEHGYENEYGYENENEHALHVMRCVYGGADDGQVGRRRRH